MLPEIPIRILKDESPAIYPLGAEAITGVIRPIDKTIPSVEKYLDETMTSFANENPNAAVMLLNFPNDRPRAAADHFRLGVVFAYETFKKRSELPLPVLSEEFVDDYALRMEEINEAQRLRNEPDVDFEGGAVVQKNLFRLLEKDAYKAFVEETVGEGNSVFDTQGFYGFVTAYFMLREGFSNPSNWE